MCQTCFILGPLSLAREKELWNGCIVLKNAAALETLWRWMLAELILIQPHTMPWMRRWGWR